MAGWDAAASAPNGGAGLEVSVMLSFFGSARSGAAQTPARPERDGSGLANMASRARNAASKAQRACLTAPEPCPI